MNDPRADGLRSGYATVARAYREQLGNELAGKPLDRAFLDAFVERCAGGRIADIGCGPGHVARYLAGRGSNVEGLDLSPEMIDEARAAHPDIAFRVGDMFALLYESGSLAGIVAFYAIVHLRSQELVPPFREFHRMLAPGGLAAIASTPAPIRSTSTSCSAARRRSTSCSIRPSASSRRSSRPASRWRPAWIASRTPAPSTRASERTCSSDGSRHRLSGM